MCIGILKFWMQFAVCYVFCVLLSFWIFAAVSFPSSIKQSASCQFPVAVCQFIHLSFRFIIHNNNNDRHSTTTLIKYINSTLETFRLSVCCVNDHFGNEQFGASYRVVSFNTNCIGIDYVCDLHSHFTHTTTVIVRFWVVSLEENLFNFRKRTITGHCIRYEPQTKEIISKTNTKEKRKTKSGWK